MLLTELIRSLLVDVAEDNLGSRFGEGLYCRCADPRRGSCGLLANRPNIMKNGRELCTAYNNYGAIQLRERGLVEFKVRHCGIVQFVESTDEYLESWFTNFLLILLFNSVTIRVYLVSLLNVSEGIKRTLIQGCKWLTGLTMVLLGCVEADKSTPRSDVDREAYPITEHLC